MKGSAILPAFSKRGGHFPDGSSMLDGCFLVLRCNNRTEHLELFFFFWVYFCLTQRRHGSKRASSSRIPIERMNDDSSSIFSTEGYSN
jgi:hypothetical protein